MADAYTDACHAMRRWKTTIKTVVPGFSLPVASFSHPARKKSLILRLMQERMTEKQQIVKRVCKEEVRKRKLQSTVGLALYLKNS